MKKHYYDIGSFMYMRSQKRGLETAAIVGIACATASVGVGVGSSLANKSAVEDANEKNMALNDQALAQQKELFSEGNIFNMREAQKARDFNAQESQLNRDFQANMLNTVFNKQDEWYEKHQSMSAKYQEYLDAGLNPALVSGAQQGSTPTFSVPSGSAASGSAASSSSVGIPNIFGNQPASLSGLGNVMSNALQDVATIYDTAKTKEETKGIVTENQFKEMTIKKGLELTDSEIKKNFNQAEYLSSESELAKKKIDEVSAVIKNLEASSQNLSAESQLKNIQKIYANDYFKNQAKEIEERYNLTKGQADTIEKYVLSQVASNLGSAASAYANAEYMKSLSSLTPFEKAQIEAATKFIDTQDRREKFNLFIDNRFTFKERFWKLQQQKEEAGISEYHNSWQYKTIGAIKDVAVGVGASVGTALGIYTGARGFKVQPAKVSNTYKPGNSIFNP